VGAKILLCVSADQATAAVWNGRRLTSCRSFASDEGGVGAFASFLASTRRAPVHILVDTVDEDYRFETLPHAKGRDRAEMVARKLKQLYRGTSFYAYSLQSREADKRKDDRYLFAAITNPELLAPWLRAINAQELPVAGVYSLPTVSVSLITDLKLKHPNLLLVTKGNAGVRQTFFKDLRFRISRLTPLRETVESADQYYADEVGNTRMYLDALTITHVDDTLSVVILDQDNSLAELPEAISRGRPNMQCARLSQADIVSRFGIAPTELAASIDALHLHLLGESTPPQNFAPPHVTQGFQRHVGRRLIYAASAAILLVGLAWSGVNVMRTKGVRDATAALARQAQDYQSRYLQVTSQFPQAPTSTENLRNTVEIAEALKRSMRTPEAMMALVSRALDASPDVQLTRMGWHYGPADPAAGVDGTQAGQPGGSSEAAPMQGASLRGEIRPFNGDFKRAMALVHAFAGRIAADPRVAEVRAVRLPLNASSDTGLSGSTNTGQSGNAEFELNVTFKAGA
jgi:hypothetical protein